MGRRKPDAKRKVDQIRIRITVTEKARLVAAAEADGQDVSEWLRDLALRRATRVLGPVTDDSAEPTPRKS